MAFRWDAKKDTEIQIEGRPSFEDALNAVLGGGVTSDGIHPNQAKYPGQRVMVVMIGGYAHLMPYEVRGNDIWLITLFPSRKANRS